MLSHVHTDRSYVSTSTTITLLLTSIENHHKSVDLVALRLTIDDLLHAAYQSAKRSNTITYGQQANDGQPTSYIVNRTLSTP